MLPPPGLPFQFSYYWMNDIIEIITGGHDAEGVCGTGDEITVVLGQ